ncbi:MAG: hypothetical protein ACTSYI_08715 [Promethearchaeota archaeon]
MTLTPSHPITVLGGQNVVGGSKIIYQFAPQFSFLFDFGFDFDRANSILDRYLSPRIFNKFVDKLRTGFLPIPTAQTGGVYRSDLVIDSLETITTFTNPAPFIQPPYVKVAFLSHAHTDHVGEVRYLHESIPLVCSTTTAKLLKIFETIKRGELFTGILNYSDIEGKSHSRKVKHLISGRPWNWGKNMTITAYETDHSLPGATAFLVNDKKNNCKLIYSGDLRWHGLYQQRVTDFVEAAKKFSPDYLIIEQTNLGEHKGKPTILSEEQVGKQLKSVVKECQGLVWMEWAHGDMSRLQMIASAAEYTNRNVVLPAMDYLFLRECITAKIPEVENISLSRFRVFLPRKKSGTYIPKDYSYDHALYTLCLTKDEEKLKLRAKYNHIDLNQTFLVKASDLRNSPQSFLVYHDIFKMYYWVDCVPTSDDVYIISKSRIDEPEAMLMWDKRKAWLDLFGFTKDRVHQIHASGHLYPKDYERMVNEINAKHIIKVHGETN